uniref:Uncharacterized protein n=1 Tax=viral metagenome TaxID=1070528 RepID=A0A6C0IWS5_9ZZZZ
MNNVVLEKLDFQLDTEATEHASLFNPNGPTSLGSLPRAPTVIRQDAYQQYMTSVKQENDFPIGAITRTEDISRAMLDKGAKELKHRQEPRRHSIMEDDDELISFTDKSMRNVLLSDNVTSNTEKAGARNFESRDPNVISADVAAPSRTPNLPSAPTQNNANKKQLFESKKF